ncbi:MAG: hypothetical protein MJ231_00740 [bacterium]|nr:hypothetical protein [bacterium]
MYKELTSEEVVTGLISSGEILSPVNKNVYISNPKHNLGDFLANIKNSTIEPEKKSRYSFIKEGLWKV